MESASDVARAWLAALPDDALFTSCWCQTEISSALAIKAGRGEIAAHMPAIIAAGIADLLSANATSIAVRDAQVQRAREMIERCPLSLRGPDALHLAIAQSANVPVWTLDVEMAAAGQALNLETRLLD